MNEVTTLSSEETKVLRDFLNFAGALQNSLTSQQIAGLAATLGEMLPLLNELGSPSMNKLIVNFTQAADSLSELLLMVNQYHKSGALKKGMDMIAFLGVLQDALSSDTIARLAEGMSNTLVVGDQIAVKLGGLKDAQKLLEQAEQAAQEAERDRSELGVFGLMKLLKEPAVQKGLKFAIYFLRNLQKQA